MNPLVSVILAVHNGEDFLADALASVASQDYHPLDVIVVDDGSMDTSALIARESGLGRVVSISPMGVSHARNHGLLMAIGDLVTFIDHDDVWLPTKTSTQVGHLLAHPETGCVLGRQEIFCEPGFSPPHWMTRDKVYGDLDGIPLVSGMFRTAALHAIGGYDPSYSIAEDRDLFVRLREVGCRIDVLDEVVLRRRFHATNRSHQSHRNGHALLRSLKAKADREREAARRPSDG